MDRRSGVMINELFKLVPVNTYSCRAEHQLATHTGMTTLVMLKYCYKTLQKFVSQKGEFKNFTLKFINFFNQLVLFQF
jgi:hypothetical protein